MRRTGENGPGQVRVQRDGDVNLYHLGNNGLHREIYQRALEKPGVVVIHDAVLHHFMLGTLSHEAYVAEFIYNYGAWNVDLAEELWRGRARSGTDPVYFEYPMLRRVVESARAVIVHNGAARRVVEAHGATRVIEIPHLFVPPVLPPGYELARFRQQLGVDTQTALFGVFGHLRESKRLIQVLEAIRKVDGAALVVAGDFVSSDLERAMEPLLHHSRVIRCGYLPEELFWKYAASVDACINLRYPPAGETSGIAIRLMGIGKPVLVTAGDETAAYPEAACLRVDAGVAESDTLIAYMTWLTKFPASGHHIGRIAAEHIASHHDAGHVAEAYWKVLEEART